MNSLASTEQRIDGAQGTRRLTIVYVSWSVLPSQFANAVQVVRMVNAMVATDDAEVMLIARRARGDRRSNRLVAMDCGLDPRIKLTLLSSIRLAAGLKLLSLVNSRKIGNGAPDAVYSRVLPIFLRRIPVRRRIYEIHEPPRANWRLKPAAFDHVVRSDALTDLVYISDGLQRIMESEHAHVLGPSNVRRHVLHSGGPSPEAYCEEPHEESFTLAYAGRPDKLDSDLIVALAQAEPGLRIRVYGPTARFAGKFSALPNVELLGWVDPSELPARLCKAHVLIAPYAQVAASEWFSPVKIFDYGAAGRPILISDHPPIRTIFPDGKIGRLLPPGDLEAWRAALAALRADPELREKMGRAGLDFAESYSMVSRARRVIEIIRSTPNN